MIPDVRMAGPAFTVLAEDDHLPVMSALAEAAPGDVLVIAASGGSRAVFGELFATEARRRGLAGIVADGFCRDLRGLREDRAAGVRARHHAALGHDGLAGRARPARLRRLRGRPGDIVFGDDDGLLIAPGADRGRARRAPEAIGRAERAILAAQARGEALHDLTNHAEHVAALDRGEAQRAGVPGRCLTSQRRSRGGPASRAAASWPRSSRAARPASCR